MNRPAVFGILALVCASAGACATVDSQGGGTFVAAPGENTTAFAEPPELVYVDTGIAVVENSDVPVYYADDTYWSNQEGTWYRADYWDSPWVAVDVADVPAIFGYRDARLYRHYHGRPGDHRWREPREHSGETGTALATARRHTTEPGQRYETPRHERPANERQPVPAAAPAEARPVRPPPLTPPREAPRPAPHPVVLPPVEPKPTSVEPPRLIPPVAQPEPPKNIPRPAPHPSPAPPRPQPPPTKTHPNVVPHH
jgi:hypothetical protein